MSAVGEWVKAPKVPGGTLFTGEVRSLPTGEDGAYEIKFPGMPEPVKVPKSQVPDNAKAGGEARPSRTARGRDGADARAATRLDSASRPSVLATMGLLRMKGQQDGWASEPQLEHQQDDHRHHLQQQQEQQEQEHGEVEEQQQLHEALPPWRQPTARSGPEERLTQQSARSGADSGENLALTVAREARAAAKEARAAADKLTRRLEKSEEAWGKKEQQWTESLRAEEEQRAALAQELEAERERATAERARSSEVAQDVLDAQTRLSELESELKSHIEIFQAAVRPLQDAVPVLQEETETLHQKLTATQDELGDVAEAMADEIKEFADMASEDRSFAQERLSKLQTENDDQRDAIGHLMDVMEHTMTVDDGTELHDQLTAAISERADAVSAKCDEHGEKLEGVEKLLTDKVDDVTEQIKRVGAESEKGEARLEQMITSNTEQQTAIETTLTAAIEQNLAKATELSERLDTSTAHLAQALETVAGELRSECAAGLETSKDEIAAARSVADEHHHRLSVRVDDLGTALRARMVQVAEAMDAKLVTRTEDLRARVESTVESLSDEMKSTSTTLGTQVRDLTAFVDKETSDIMLRIDEQGTQLRERAEDEKQRVNDLVAQVGQTLIQRMETGTDAMDERVSAMDSKVDKTTAELVESVDGQLKQQDTQMRDLSAQVDASLAKLLKMHEAMQLEVQQFVIEVGLDKEITQASISRVDTKLGDVAHKLTKDVQEHRAHVTRLTAESAGLIQTKTAELASTIQLHNNQLVKDNAELNQKMVNYNADYDVRLRDIVSKSDQLERGTAKQVQQLTEDMTLKDSAVQRELEALKASLPQKVRLLDEQVRARFETVDQHLARDREDMLELTTELGKRITAKASESMNTVRALEEQTKASAASLDSQLSDALGQLQTSTNDRAIRHDQRLDLLERGAASTQQEVRKVAQSTDSLDVGLQNLQRESTEAVTRLDQQITVHDRTVGDKFVAMQESLQESVKDVRSTIMTTGNDASLATDRLASDLAALKAAHDKALVSLGEELSKMEQKADDNHVRVMQTHRTLDEKLSQRCTTNESRLANHQQQREIDMQDISNKFEAAAASLNVRLADFMEQTMDAQKNLVVQNDEKHDMHTKTARETSAAVERCQASLTTNCASLEKRFFAKDNALDKQVGDLRHRLQERQKQWTQAHNDLEAAQHEKQMESERRAAEQWEQLSHKCADLEKDLLALNQESTDRQTEMQSSLANSYNELNEKHSKQTEKLQAALDDAVKDLAVWTEKSSASLADLEGKATSLQTGLSALQNDHRVQLEDVVTHSNEKLEQLTTTVLQRAAKTDADISSLTISLESDTRNARNSLTNLEQRFTEMAAASDSALDEIKTRLVVRVEDVERKAEAQLSEHQAQVVEINSELSRIEASTSTQISSLDARSTSTVALLEEKSADQHHSHVTELANMKTTLTSKIENLTKLHSDLSETVASNHKTAAQEASHWKQTIIDRSEDETRRVDSQLAGIGDSIRQLETASSEKTEGVARQLSDFIQNSGATSERTRTLMSELDTRVSSNLGVHGDNLVELRKELELVVKDLTARSDANHTMHSDALELLKKEMATGMQGLKDHCDHVEAAGATVRQEATAEMAKVQADVQNELSGLQGRVFSRTQETDARLDSLLQATQEDRRASMNALSSLTAKLNEHHTSTDMRINNLDAQLGEATQRIELKIGQVYDESSRRVEELHDEVGRDGLQFKRSLSAQEIKLDSAIESHDRQFKEQREHFTKVATATAALVTESCKRTETTLSDKLNEVRTELLDNIAAIDQQVDNRKNEVIGMYKELQASTDAQAQELKEQALELQAKMDFQHNQLTGTTNDIRADAAERDSRDALRHETITSMFEIEVKRVATAQQEQDARFTSQLSDISSVTNEIERRISTELSGLSKEVQTSSMSLKEDITRQTHKLADLEGKSRLELGRLEKTMSSLHKTACQELDNRARRWTTELHQLERELRDVVGEHSRNSKADQEALVVTLNTLSATVAASELKLANRVDSLHKELTEQHADHTVSVEENMTALRKRLDDTDQKDITVRKDIATLRTDVDAGQQAAADATEALRLSTDEKVNTHADQHATAHSKLGYSIKEIAANLQAEVARAKEEQKRQAAYAAEMVTDLEILCKEQASAARRDAVQEVLGQVSPAIVSAQATLLLKCDNSTMKTQLMMVDNEIKDLTEAVKTLAEEVRDEEPARVIDQRLDVLDADVADVSAEISILSAMVESVE